MAAADARGDRLLMLSPRHQSPIRAVALVLSCLAGLASSAVARDIQGRVVRIADGDAITVRTGQRRQVRAARRKSTHPSAGNPTVIARVFVGARDINAEMVRRGGDWVSRRYSANSEMARLEGEARAVRRGLRALADTQRVALWSWRAGQKAGHGISHPGG